jgi:hypothetical protein
MNNNPSERNISLIGKSGREYYGKIYKDKMGDTSLSGRATVCLSNSQWEDNHWEHLIKDIYHDDVHHALDHFNERNDISHLIIIQDEETENDGVDAIEDLRRQYIHR